MASEKPRSRGAIYPYELLVRLEEEMGERLNQAAKDNGLTRVGFVRKVLENALPEWKPKKDTSHG